MVRKQHGGGLKAASGWMTNVPNMTVRSGMYMGWTTPFSEMRFALYPDKIN